MLNKQIINNLFKDMNERELRIFSQSIVADNSITASLSIAISYYEERTGKTVSIESLIAK